MEDSPTHVPPVQNTSAWLSTAAARCGLLAYCKILARCPDPTSPKVAHAVPELCRLPRLHARSSKMTSRVLIASVLSLWLPMSASMECSDSDACCTNGAFTAAGEVCRPAQHDECDIEEVCTGLREDCPPDLYKSPGTSCTEEIFPTTAMRSPTRTASATGANAFRRTAVVSIRTRGAPSTTARRPRPCLLYTSPSPRDAHESRMPSSA